MAAAMYGTFTKWTFALWALMVLLFSMSCGSEAFGLPLSCTSVHQKHRPVPSSNTLRAGSGGFDQHELDKPSSLATQQGKWKTPVLSVMLAASLAVACTTPAALAVVDPSVFTNDYSDPLHPQCKRHVEVSRDGTTFHYSGTAVGPKDDPVLRGCSPREIKEFGIRRGQFDGLIIGDGKISAGDGVHEGVWEPAFSVSGQPFNDVDGIRWNDGNKWAVVKKSWVEQGAEFIFWAYISVSMAAGAKGLYDGIQRKRAQSN